MLKLDYLGLIKLYGLNEVKEQRDFLTNPEYGTPEKPLVLAGGTGFGKTFTTILKLIMFYSNPENQGKKVIILPSSTKVLRNNFMESFKFFKDKNLPFQVEVAKGKRDFKRLVQSDVEVIIVLPQTLADMEELPKVEWLVVDEAHKWYFAKTIENIIEKTNPTYQLLLTGTPFKFNGKNAEKPGSYLMYYVPIEDMIAAGNVGNPLIEVVSSSINLKDNDYNENTSDIRSTLKWSYKENKDQLVSVAKEINKTLKTRMRKTTIGRMLGVFGIDKTIIYCYSKKQARHFYKIFQKSDLAGKVLLSDSESDIDSTEFAKFKDEENYRVLLVVDRGKEGFDMPELFNIVDFTLSTNPEIILQILGRVFRISLLQPNKQKRYYKVASQNTAPFILTLMTGVLQLVKREYYETFTGKFTDLKVPMMPKSKGGSKRKNSNTFSTRALRYFQDVNIPLEANFWNQLKFRQGDVWKTMGQTTIQAVLSEMQGRGTRNFLSKEYITEEALEFDDFKVWREERQPSYQMSRTMGFMREIISHMKNQPTRGINYTKEECIAEAQKYDTSSKWNQGNQKSYNTAKENGWFDECVAHMVRPKDFTVEEIFESAKPYKTQEEWKTAHPKYHGTATRRGILKQVTKHMPHARIKSVNQLDKETGKVIATYSSTMEAARVFGKNSGQPIINSIKLPNRTAWGYKWEYSNNNFTLKTK